MTSLSAAASLILIALALLHLAWALRLWIPIRDETRLARATVGLRGITTMPPPGPCIVVAAALLFAAALPFAPNLPAQPLLTLAAAAVFGLRSAITYLPAWRARFTEEPFARLDRRAYGPLCLALGAALALPALTGA